MTYLIRVNGEEQGPYSFDDLEMYERMGEIGASTEVRAQDDSAWSAWAAAKQLELKKRERIRWDNQFALPARIDTTAASRSDKSRGLFIILALLFGTLGLHNFYAGRYAVGFAQFFLTITLAPVGLIIHLPLLILVTAVWAIMDALIQDADGTGARMA
jgi:TM2 domain-containing membrane protein YozV